MDSDFGLKTGGSVVYVHVLYSYVSCYVGKVLY